MSTPAAFNDLRLPVLWIRDDKNPGTPDPGELYVHPSFWAVNTVLTAEGKQPIPVEQIVSAGLKGTSKNFSTVSSLRKQGSITL